MQSVNTMQVIESLCGIIDAALSVIQNKEALFQNEVTQ